MAQTVPRKMRAVAIDAFGDIERLAVKELPVPQPDSDEILIRVEAAGIGVWDSFELQGGFAQMFQTRPRFPYVPGADGAGTVVAIGEKVRRFKEGDRVYGFSQFDGRGFHAEYAAIKEVEASAVPDTIPTEQAGAMPVDAITALRGLSDTLKLKAGESLMIFGASGGIGHLALQLAKRLGSRVFAVASGRDGVALVKSLGADFAVDGREDDVVAAAQKFAPGGLDAALLTAGGPAAEKALSAMRSGGRVAYPNGVEPEPRKRAGIKIEPYDGVPDQETIEKLNQLIKAEPFTVHVSKIFPLEKLVEAEKTVNMHHLGKFEVRPGL